MWQKIKPYILAMRLQHQNPVLVALLAGSLDAHYYNLPVLALVGLAALGMSIGIYLINEYVDAKDTDIFQLRNKVLTRHHLNPKTLTAVYLALTLPGLAVFLFFGLIWQAFAIVIIGAFYSLPPLRFKAHFPWDLISQGICFLIGTYSIPFQFTHQSLYAVFTVPLISLMFFLTTAQLIHLIIDYQADKAAHLNNTGVVLGPNNLLRLAKALLLSSVFGFAYLLYKNSHFWYYPLVIVAPYVGWSLGRLREVVFYNKDYNPKPIDNPLLTTYERAIRMGNFLVIYFLIILVYLASR